MRKPVITVAQEGTVRTITLQRPERRNALNGAVLDALFEQVDDLVDDSATDVVVLAGAGPVFSAGADLGGGRSDGDSTPLAPPPGSWVERRGSGARWSRLLDQWEGLPQLTVARVQGAAIGGGCLLAVMCDLRVVAQGTFFNIPEVAIGMPLPWGGMPRLVREVGLPRARDLVVTGRRVDAAEALEWGLANRVVAPDKLDEGVAEVVASLTAMPPGPLRMSKAAFAAMARTAPGMAIAWPDPDLSAFAGRDPETAEAAMAYRKRLLGR